MMQATECFGFQQAGVSFCSLEMKKGELTKIHDGAVDCAPGTYGCRIIRRRAGSDWNNLSVAQDMAPWLIHVARRGRNTKAGRGHPQRFEKTLLQELLPWLFFP